MDPVGGAPNDSERGTEMRSVKDAKRGTSAKAVADNADHNALWKTANNADQTILETPQVNMNQGIKMFGEAGIQTVKQEMQQLHDRKVMRAKDATEITREQKKEALAYLMFLKRKHRGKD